VHYRDIEKKGENIPALRNIKHSQKTVLSLFACELLCIASQSRRMHACMHGGVYKIINDAPLAYVTKKQLEEMFGDKLQWAHQQRTEHEDEAEQEKTQAQIPLEKLIDLSKLKPTSAGEYQGAHPIHGSQTGQNFCVNTDKNVWHCFRCNSGGGGLMWIAVKNEIIQCHEAKKGVLRGAKFLEACMHAKVCDYIVTTHATVSQFRKD
jgi:hypothetical protein